MGLCSSDGWWYPQKYVVNALQSHVHVWHMNETAQQYRGLVSSKCSGPRVGVLLPEMWTNYAMNSSVTTGDVTDTLRRRLNYNVGLSALCFDFFFFFFFFFLNFGI